MAGLAVGLHYFPNVAVPFSKSHFSPARPAQPEVGFLIGPAAHSAEETDKESAVSLSVSIAVECKRRILRIRLK
jgi:hypothetical protein